ncbi:MAG: methyltransferase domain-containing protein [Candidatus Lokiarchaeota archaeon]|nr:methyltransferase domain-containing protein [Candidatus Lokiarchaeota archaeon]
MSQENEKKGTWFGDFGIQYTVRNKIVPEKLVPFYKRILKDLDVQKILEVGCNRGHNLNAISYCGQYDLYGIDINPYGILLARDNNKEISFTVGNIFDILYKDNFFDLVMTVGVLIHINPEQLKIAISEILRVSKKYFLMMEYNYDFDEFEKVPYRNNVGLWRGNFKKLVLDNFNVKLVSEGETGPEEGFGDKRGYFLFEKQ